MKQMAELPRRWATSCYCAHGASGEDASKVGGAGKVKGKVRACRLHVQISLPCDITAVSFRHCREAEPHFTRGAVRAE